MTGNCGSVQLELAVGIDGRYVHKRDLATYEWGSMDGLCLKWISVKLSEITGGKTCSRSRVFWIIWQVTVRLASEFAMTSCQGPYVTWSIIDCHLSTIRFLCIPISFVWSAVTYNKSGSLRFIPGTLRESHSFPKNPSQIWGWWNVSSIRLRSGWRTDEIQHVYVGFFKVCLTSQNLTVAGRYLQP